MATFDDEGKQVRGEVLDEIAEVLAYAEHHKWGKRASTALAAAALSVSGSMNWNDRRKQEQAVEDLRARAERVSARKVEFLTEKLKER